MTFCDILPLPSCTEPYAFQVAGHTRSNSNGFEFLKDLSKPLVYKSFQDCSRGIREAMFYHHVFANDAIEALVLLRQFIPNYHGIFQCQKSNAIYIGLSDLLATFSRPNVCDLKLGMISYFPDTPITEIQKERSKYIWRRKLGFLLSGMQVYDAGSHCFIKVPKTFGRNLAPEQVYSVGLLTFLGSNITYRIKLAQNYINKLNDVLNWYSEIGARYLTFCRSSILLIHESLDTDEHRQSSTSIPVHIDVKLIDFAHCVEKPHSKQTTSADSYWSCELTYGFRHGLLTLINMMQRVILDSSESDRLVQDVS